ncbi:MAG: hypothetical protein ACTTK2_02855 [Hoylesella marshii]|uniref:hypothetical protein n=1 Tax=Hoylesella marshii TaxID=189722 RepID=UPI003FA12856
MCKNQVTVQDYIAPATRIIPMQQPCSLLAGSPKVNPGGGGTHVNPSPEDDEDDDGEVSGAKSWKLWEEKEE